MIDIITVNQPMLYGIGQMQSAITGIQITANGAVDLVAVQQGRIDAIRIIL